MKQHIASYDYFVNVEMKTIVKANSVVESEVDPEFFVRFRDIHIHHPQSYDTHAGVYFPVTPQQCRLRDLTYAAHIYIDFTYRRGNQVIHKDNMDIGRMPIMLRSSKCALTGKSVEEVVGMGECPLDPGGYFILRGVERVILIQEQLSKNRIIVERDSSGAIAASAHSVTETKRSKTSLVYTSRDRVVVRNNSLTADVPVTTFMKALGIESDRELTELICGTSPHLLHLFTPTLLDTPTLSILTQHQALTAIGAKIKIGIRSSRTGVPQSWADAARDLLADSILPHIPVDEIGGGFNFRPKAVHLGLMARRTLEAVAEGGVVDDRDFVGNKSAGHLLAILFEDLFKSWIASIRRAVDANFKRRARADHYDPASAVLQTSRIITDGLFRAISSGNWRVRRFKMDKAGVTQVLTRMSFASAVGTLARIQSQFEKSRKVSGPRALQTSQWGMICPADTPEGETCGLIKHVALMSHITTDSDGEPIRRLLFTLGVQDINLISASQIHTPASHLVFLNGAIIGILHHPAKLVQNFRRLRRAGRVPPFASIYRGVGVGQRTVNISSDGGRICRPLIIVSNGKSKISENDLRSVIHGLKNFDDLVLEGKIEYLDVNEELDSNVAMHESDLTHYRTDTTHLEIAPFTILGAVAGLTPFPHHNQSPRNTYQCAMGKQATGAIAYNQYDRIDSLVYLMVYPQVPLVRTRTMEVMGFDKLPAGQNATLAVMSFSGYDIEDAIVLNKASLDRGFGRCQVFRKFQTTIKAYANCTSDFIARPNRDKDGIMVHQKEEALDEDGIGAVGEHIRSGQIFVNKQTPVDVGPQIEGDYLVGFKPAPLVCRLPGESVIDKVLLAYNEESQLLLKTSIRQTRRPEIGDKFSSRHGQKGVCGIIVDEADMPFSDTGVLPDLIMNPHGFPSRMTVGKMLELVTGKAG
ncbi:DNA-directed RNA polymerase III core subunit ret1, partial [Borealophlyctis nickersoniae]